MKQNPMIFRVRGLSLKKGLPVLFAFLVVILGSPALRAQTLTNYFNNFDSLTAGQSFTGTAVSGITGNDNGTTTQISVSNATSYSGSNALFLLDNNATNTTTATVNLGFAGSFAGVTNDSVSFQFKSNNNTTAGIGVLGASSAVNFTLVHEGYGGVGNAWELRSGGSTVIAYVADASIGYTASNWSLISFTFNEATNSLSLSVNGTAALTVANGVLTSGTAVGTPDFNSVNWNINQLTLTSGYYSGASATYYNYFDDLSVVSVPEPGTLTLIALSLVCGGGLMTLKRRKGFSGISLGAV